MAKKPKKKTAKKKSEPAAAVIPGAEIVNTPNVFKVNPKDIPSV
jgi:hypothetical protein